MWKIILSLFVTMVAVFMGSWFIGDAIKAFKERCYYKFGVNLMLAIWEAALMIKYII